jgi:hypothetical protein
MVDRHFSLNLKPWSARTPYVYTHADLAQKYSIGLQWGNFCLQVVFPGRKFFFPALFVEKLNLLCPPLNDFTHQGEGMALGLGGFA